MSYYIALVRDPRNVVKLLSSRHGSDRSRTWPDFMFLHGDAVTLAGPETDEAALGRWIAGREVVVCTSSWRRRMGKTQPVAGCRFGSLVEFFDRLDNARQLCSAGLGGACFEPQVDASRLLIEIGFAPDTDHQRLEALEFGLAAAALELDAEIHFCEAGWLHLRGDRARGWRQFIDHDLLPLRLIGTDSGDPEPALPDWLGRAKTSAAFDRSRRTILRL